MSKLIQIIIVAGLLGLGVIATIALGAAGTISDTNRTAGFESRIQLIPIRWSATNSVNSAVGYTDFIRGEILRVVATHSIGTNPANMSITVADTQGNDVLCGLGTCASGTTYNIVAGMRMVNGTNVTASNIWPWCVNEKLLVTVTNCGSNAVGTLYFYVR